MDTLSFKKKCLLKSLSVGIFFFFIVLYCTETYFQTTKQTTSVDELVKIIKEKEKVLKKYHTEKKSQFKQKGKQSKSVIGYDSAKLCPKNYHYEQASLTNSSICISNLNFCLVYDETQSGCIQCKSNYYLKQDKYKNDNSKFCQRKTTWDSLPYVFLVQMGIMMCLDENEEE